MPKFILTSYGGNLYPKIRLDLRLRALNLEGQLSEFSNKGEKAN